MKPESNQSILLLDSDEQSALDIQRFLKVSAYAFSVSHASDISEGLNYVKNRKPDLILLDSSLVNQKDFSAFKQLSIAENIPVILLSAENETETQKQAERAGASDYLIKNKINLFHLQKTIVNALKLNEVETKLDDTRTKFVSQHDSLYKLLNKVNCGVLVINKQNEILYANEKVYGIIGEENWKNHVTTQLVYREIEREETIEFNSGRKNILRVRTSPHDWNGEKANLLMLEDIPITETSNSIGQNEALNTILNTVRDHVVLLKDNRIVFANKGALQNLQQTLGEVSGKLLSDFFEGKETVFENILITSFLNQRESTGIIKQSNGQLVPVKFSTQPVTLIGEVYELLLFTIIVKDEDLSIPGARNDEERFSSEEVLHLASHDLREPVRTILNYVQLIGENLQKKNYDSANEYANYAKEAAGRMEKLLNDLKTYIGLNEHKFTLNKVSMKLILADVLKQMKPRLIEASAEVSFTELPDVSADRELVEKLLLHLIDNAVKFKKPGKNPVIDIGYDKFEGNIIFCVRDNGIGISRKYYSKIFELFERLNRVDEFPGNGLGLPICKKITELHGGEIWVESLPGSGSNFYFTLKGK